MKKSNHTLILLCAILLLCSAAAVSAQDVPPVDPNRAQLAINLMAIDCQNLNDLSYALTAGNTESFEAIKKSSATASSNISYLLGDFASDLTSQYSEIWKQIDGSAGSATNAANVCQNLRYQISQRIEAFRGAFPAPMEPVTDFDACVKNGYFVSDGTCFMNGNAVFDPKGYIVGLYNADCFVPSAAYYGTCWYCEYGNTENGCSDFPY